MNNINNFFSYKRLYQALETISVAFPSHEALSERVNQFSAFKC